MKFRSCQIQTPLKELQVGSNQGRSRIFVVPGVKAGSEDPTSLVRAERIPASYLFIYYLN